LIRTVDEIFGSEIFSIDDLTEPFFPSTSANYINSRKNLGAVGHLYEVLLKEELRQEFLDISHGIVEVGHPVSRIFGALNKVEQDELDRVWDQDQEWKTTLGAYVNVDRFKTRWRLLYWQIFKRAIDEEPLVEPVGLAEALKIRVISKGPPMLYTALKPLQQFMWRTLKKHKVFELIGKPVSEEIIMSCLGNIDDGRDVIISGDYKNSTDNLHSWVSECIARRMSWNLRKNGFFPEVLEEMLVKSLIHHNFGTISEPLPQREGQLMGSVTSFPILCIANAGFCRWSLEEANEKTYNMVGTRLPPLRVNGDDCVLKGCKNSLIAIWEKITAFGGLSTSVGKTYYSRKFAVINSVLYDYHPARMELSDPWDTTVDERSRTGLTIRRTGCSWVERKYINLGLLFGIKRSSGAEDGKVGVESLGELHKMLKETCPEERWDAVNRKFINIHRETLERFRHIPWYVPTWAGGFGLVPHKPHSHMERMGISLLKKHWLAKGESLNLPTAAKWKMHKLVCARLRPYLFECEHSIVDVPWFEHPVLISDSFSQLYKYATVETLFVNPMEDLVQSPNTTLMKNACKQNSRLWKAIGKSYDLSYGVYGADPHNVFDVEACPEEDLQPQQMKDNYPCCIM